MKPTEGRRRIVIEEVQPLVDAGRYPAKHTLDDLVTVTAAIFGDGHDHVAARLLYRHDSQSEWQHASFSALPNDIWSAKFVADKLGLWHFTIEAWVDHFDTWMHDLEKRLAAQPDPKEPTQQVGPQDIPLALRIGAGHLEAAAARATGGDARKLAAAALDLRVLADANHPLYDPIPLDDVALLTAKYPELRFSSWYEIFPRSCSPTPDVHGTFRDLAVRVPEIAAMGFDVLYMPPIHPIGIAFRKGKNNSVTAAPGDVGSPWAIGAKEGGHTAILADLGTLDDFAELVKTAQANGMEIALDIAFQCSPDHPWVTEHPERFLHRPDGTIQYAENPPKKYQDIYPLNFESKNWTGLWDALYGVFKFWVDRGVRIFRVDNPHTKALPFWEWCIAEIQRKTPEAIFLAEAFTRPHVMYSLAKAGFTQGYTYFTWRNTKADLQSYFEELTTPPVVEFFRPNVWPNTPDILHEQLQEADPIARRAIFLQRVILAATLSSNYGIYGPAYELCEWRPAKPAPGKAGSEEYLDSEKYQLRHWDLRSPISISQELTLLNSIRRENPALQRNESLRFHACPNPSLLCYSKSTPDFSNTILVAVNLDNHGEQSGIIDLDMMALGLPWQGDFEVEDLLTGARFQWRDQWNYVALRPEVPAHILRIIR